MQRRVRPPDPFYDGRVTRKSITTSHAAVACDVCGRTLLRGENADVFLVSGSRKMVCELCTARATHEGWIREGMDLGPARRDDRRRRGSLFGRLRGRRDGGGSGNGGGANGHDPLPPGGGEQLYEDWEYADEDPAPAPQHAAAQAPAPQPAPSRGRQPEPVYEPPRERRDVHAVPTNADLKMGRALELFNGSEHPRTVAGVARSLGRPLVCVRPSPTEGSVVGITVAWELSWYRYEADLADEASGVRVIAKGYELDELEEHDKVANASADERGELALGLA